MTATPVAQMFDDQIAATAPTTPHRALYLRWRPRRFEDVVGQEHVTRTLRNAVKLNRLAHAYLFTGPRGTGKTSVARILYRAANCPNVDDGDPCNVCPLCVAALDGRALDLIEIDAASNRGIDDIRDLRDKVAYRPGDGRFKLYIIDEAHELTPQAWDAFLKTLEEPPAHALFVLATTEAHKVPPTIVSRCQRFDFRRIPFADTREQLARVAASEGMNVDAAVLEQLALVARGGLRDALSLLDQLSAYATGELTLEIARVALSLPSVEAVRGALEGMTRRDPAAVMALLSDVAEGGADVRLFVDELLVHLRALLLLRTGADARLTDELPADEVAWLRERAPAWSVGTLIRLVQTLSESLARTRDAQQFQIQAEVALLTACDVELASPREEQIEPPKPAPTRPVTPPEPVISAASEPPAQPTSAMMSDAALAARWPDVVEHVKQRNPLLASLLGRATPIKLEGSVVVVAFQTDFNRKSAESTTNRRVIEEALQKALGHEVRLRGTLSTGSQNLLDDPVINFAARTFGGEPRRLPS